MLKGQQWMQHVLSDSRLFLSGDFQSMGIHCVDSCFFIKHLFKSESTTQESRKQQKSNKLDRIFYQENKYMLDNKVYRVIVCKA